MMDTGHLAGKVVVVTGAGRGLGREFALRIAAQGGSMLVNDLSADHAETVVSEIVAGGGNAFAVPGSVADWATGEALVAAALDRFGALDGWVNNAALHYIELPWNETPDQIARLIEVNVTGLLYCGVQALKAMRAQDRGSIVNVTSGAQMGMDLRATYGASKGAAASATYGWALAVEGTGIRVNAISPLAATPMATEADADMVRFVGAPGDSANRLPDPASIAPLVTFLLSDLAAGITGQVIRCTGSALNVMRHPESAPPLVEQPEFTEETIAAAFAGPLRDALRPVGFRK